MSELEHWDYYRILENDFLETDRYVEVDARNSKTYSIEYVHLLLAIGSEVDVVAKTLCERIDPDCGARNIDDYRTVILSKYKQFFEMRLFVPKYSMEFYPWESWAAHPPKNPSWWKSYNAVKHQRSKCFVEANLENVIVGLTGLYAMIAHLYGSVNLNNAPRHLVMWVGGGFGDQT